MNAVFDIGQAFRLALAHFEAGRLAEARRLCETIERAMPNHGGAQYVLGLLALRGGQFRKAVRHLERALAATPDAPPVHVGLARAQAGLGRVEAAAHHFERALALLPPAPELHAEYADHLRRAGRIEPALAQYRRALELHPDLPQAVGALGNLLRDCGRPAEAVDYLHRAVAAKPHSAGAHNNLGVALTDLGRLDEAMGALERAIALKPDHAAAHANLATALLAAKRPDEALAAAQRAVALDRGDARLRLTLGLVLRRHGDSSAAIAAFNKALRRDPDLVAAHFNLGELWRRAGDVPRAAACFRRCLALDGADRHGASLALAGLGAEPAPPRAPGAYVRSLFDQYAERFDRELQGKLRYRGPELLQQAIAAALGPGSFALDVLDGGCGTGLAGPLLRPLARRLDGIDLSPRMLDKAAERGVYDALDTGELVDVLNGRPQAYDLVFAADVFVYLGDLAPVLAAAATALRPGGLLAFSVELHDGAGYVLGAHHRYAHASGQLADWAGQAGFTVLSMENAATRHEGGRPVPGLIVLLRRA